MELKNAGEASSFAEVYKEIVQGNHWMCGFPDTLVPFTSVKVWNNTFWGQRIETSRKVTIPLAFSKCESEGKIQEL